MGWFFGGSSFDTSKSMKCFSNEFNGRCGGCVYMNPHNYSTGLFSGYTYKCTKKGGYYRWDDRPCYSIEYVDPEKVDCCERYKDFTGRKYFILSAICEILGIDSNNKLMTEIKSLIDVVRKDGTTQREAIAYDEFGPEIADNLRSDSERVEICNYLLKDYIAPIYCFIRNNKLYEAIEMYENMVRFLFYRYQRMNNYEEIIETKCFENPKIKIK